MEDENTPTPATADATPVCAATEPAAAIAPGDKPTLPAAADTTTDAVKSDGGVSSVEHSMGQRQPSSDVYDTMYAPAALSGMDIPQKIVTAVNDTHTPGETNAVPTGDEFVNRSDTRSEVRA